MRNEHEVISGFPVFDPTLFEEGEDSPLALVFNKQRTLMSACGIENMAAWQAFYVSIFALMGEAVEAGYNFQDLTKPWKRNQIADIPHLKEEVVDMLFFVVQLAILLGMNSQELLDGYLKKSDKNFERIVEKLIREGLVE
jgi:NTP pyrophosphatase (non-canonical NTP hydrolase)